MDDPDLVIGGEVFRISERVEPGGKASYHFAWLNGPADGSYGFSIGFFDVGSESAGSGMLPRMTSGQLATEAQGFVTAFYAPRGIGEEDFPDHHPPQPDDANVPCAAAEPARLEVRQEPVTQEGMPDWNGRPLR